MPILWSTTSGVLTVLASQLNSVANNTLSSGSVAYANQTNRNIYSDWQMLLVSSSGASVSVGKYMTLYVGQTLTSAPTKRRTTLQPLAVFPLGSVATRQVVSRSNIVIPPLSCVFYLDNQSGRTLRSASNTLKAVFYKFATA